MIRRPLFLLVIALVGLAAPVAAQQERPLNVVVLLVDDWGWRDAGCYGSTFYETPNIDALAASGVRFTQAYTACPVCSPTRVSIMTGKHPARLRTTDWFGGRRKGKLLPAPYFDYLAHEEVTLGEVFGEAGYRTGFFGKWHLGRDPYTPESQGFDVNVGGHFRGSPPGGYFSPYDNPKLSDGPEGEHLPSRLADEAVQFIEDSGDDPYLCYLAFYSVHTPLQSRPDLTAKYEAKAAAAPPHEGPRFTPERAREARQVQDHAVYAGMVEAMDAAVGRVLDAVAERGDAERTIVLLTSDNGGLSTSEGSPTSNVPLRAGKGWLYEGGVRVPLVVRWPGVAAAGRKSDAVTISHDFFPTLIEAAGIPAPTVPNLDGRSLAPLLRGEVAEAAYARGPVFWHYPHYGNQGGAPSSSIRHGDWKLIHWYEDDSVELYNLATDLGETTNLAQAEPETAASLLADLNAWRTEIGAAAPTVNAEWE